VLPIQFLQQPSISVDGCRLQIPKPCRKRTAVTLTLLDIACPYQSVGCWNQRSCRYDLHTVAIILAVGPSSRELAKRNVVAGDKVMLESPAELLGELESNGLLSPSIVEHRDALLKSASAEQAAQELVRLQLLTEFQAEVTLKQEPIPLVIGDYIVETMLGHGGMGYVLKARHRRMKRPVAIKFLLKSLTDSEDFQKRFEREVEAAAQLDHQNIVTAYDAGIHDGNHYLVMQYVDGDDLSGIVKTKGPLGITAAVDVIRQAAEGLDCAHELGIIHRDIKPSNLLMDHKSVVRVLDMGLARIQRSPGDAVDGTGNADLTGTGSVLGTIDYMAPEQALDAKKADHRADIYSLGCTLYFLLTGNPPFGNETIMRRLLAHRQSKIPRLQEVRPEAPGELEQVFAMMMAKRKRDRYPSMRHLIVALDSLDLGNSEADQMATLDMPNEISGVVAESFGERPGSSHTPKSTPSDEPAVVKPKRRRQPRRARTETGNVNARAGGKKARPQKARATSAVATGVPSSETDTQSVARGETFVSQPWMKRWMKPADSLKATLAATSRTQRRVATGVGITVLSVAFAVIFLSDSTTQDGPTAAKETITRESTSPAKITHGDSNSPPASDQIVDLFDGKSLEGWESEGGDDWSVRDGILTGAGSTLLVYTKEEFKDVRVTIECRVPSGSHSGLFLRHELGSGWGSGFEAQISGDYRQASMTGGITNLQSVKAQLVPHNVWFTLEFEAIGERLKVSVNGQTTVVATSKKFSSGYVGIQSVGISHFRKVQAQRLKPSDAQKHGSNEWTNLFSGHDLSGWQTVGDSKWTASDGILHAESGPKGWLLTEQSFADYEFECEFRMSYAANSGILIHADPTLSLNGVNIAEIQLLDTSSPQFSKVNANASHGSLWQVEAPHIPIACLRGLWYRMMIRVVGSEVTVSQNGRIILNAILPDDYRREPGRIGLQAYGQSVSFRNLRARRLSD
jgi:serine/threonine protein kinase